MYTYMYVYSCTYVRVCTHVRTRIYVIIICKLFVRYNTAKIHMYKYVTKRKKQTHRPRV